MLGSLFSTIFSLLHFILWVVVTFQCSTLSTVQVCVCACTHAEEMGNHQLKCSFLGSAPSRGCLLLLGCSAGWLTATVCQFKLERKQGSTSRGSGSLLSPGSGRFSALASVTVTRVCGWMWAFPCTPLLCIPFSLEVLSVYLFFFSRFDECHIIFLYHCRCWKPGWLTSMAFIYKVCQRCRARICCYSHSGKITSKHSFVPVLLVSWQAEQWSWTFLVLDVRSNQGKVL